MGGGRACGAGSAGAGWEPCEPAEAGRRPPGAERSPAGDGEGGSWRQRRGRGPWAQRAARLCGPSGLRDPNQDAKRCLPAAPGDYDGESLAPQRG